MSDRFFLHQFDSINDTSFSKSDYGLLKFGADSVAMKFGYELADRFFEAHSIKLLLARTLVIPSPYNYVINAATVMTRHFIDRLNSLLVAKNGEHVEYATIPRKVSYINDYGYLTKEQREELINGDKFFINAEYVHGRFLIFIDDIFITGTHEKKLRSLLSERSLSNDVVFLYFAKYNGHNASIESQLNQYSIKTLKEYSNLRFNDPQTQLTVRPMKFLLSADPDEFKEFIVTESDTFRRELYFNSLNEGYYRIPKYQQNLDTLKQLVR